VPVVVEYESADTIESVPEASSESIDEDASDIADVGTYCRDLTK